MNRKIFLAIHIFVKFGYNYPNPDEFITYICEKTDRMYLKEHLREKFNHIYNTFGAHAVMNYFMCELSYDLQEALVDYAINIYGPKGMKTMYEEYKSI